MVSTKIKGPVTIFFDEAKKVHQSMNTFGLVRVEIPELNG
jgi:hypothetical protein